MIYLDNAATTFPKPASVYREADRFVRTSCGNPGRGSHTLALAAAECVFGCRVALAELYGMEAPERVIFVPNTTVGLNLAIKGFVRPGDHVLLSDLEHNSVYRPVVRLAQQGMITYDLFPSYAIDRNRSPSRICRGILERIRPNTRLLICTQASNLCSATMPIREIAALCRQRGIRLVVDAAQGAGHLPLNLSQTPIDALCLPGHKGLYGLQGSGAVLLGESALPETLFEGGNGVHSLEPDMIGEPPERYEAGTLPCPAIAGLREGVRWVKERGIDTIGDWERQLFCRLAERLGNLPECTVYAPWAAGSVLLFSVEGWTSEKLVGRLDEQGFCLRGGYHCSALGHQTLKTPEDGAVRVSFGMFNKNEDVDLLYSSIRSILREV
jgi:selenocysteine lyase/cysteine desulfurase